MVPELGSFYAAFRALAMASGADSRMDALERKLDALSELVAMQVQAVSDLRGNISRLPPASDTQLAERQKADAFSRTLNMLQKDVFRPGRGPLSYFLTTAKLTMEHCGTDREDFGLLLLRSLDPKAQSAVQQQLA